VTHRIAELTAPEVAERLSAGACAILPMGSLETHGPQAPMGDFLLAEAIADRIAAAASMLRGADALVLPAIPFGGEDFFGFTPGGIVLTPGLLQAVVEEVCGNLVRTGARRILIINGHAGSIAPVDAACRALRRRHDGLRIPTLHLWRAAGALHAELGGSAESFGHGGDPVFSVALALRPELCRPERARTRQPVPPILGLPPADFGTVRLAGVGFAVPTEHEEVAPGGVACADSRPGNAEHGARIVARLVEAGAAMVAQLKQHGG
jgi:creatinine amidohydrolase